VQLCGHAFRRVAGSGTPIRAGALDGRTDPLTGLSNYRRLISVLEAELDRSRRTQRPFSVVLFDMDGLKIINDQYGHLTGSRSLVRIGKILRTIPARSTRPRGTVAMNSRWYCRKPAKDIASRVVSRIRERLSAEPERPALSVSAGVAAFPEDGDTPERLLALPTARSTP